MPPIGGVAQGAMVLQDTMFLDLDLPRFNAVLQPKVQGSIHLDELFSEDSLDFMIFFSSMASLTGNPGQAAYNAANMFMASLAAQRQRRGLAGQAINIGAIVGNGYVTRELNMGQQSYLYKVGHTWMSEQDFQEIFAEGILSCLQRGITAEICSGLRIDDDESKDWISNPMFQHLVFKSNTMIEGDKKGKSSVMVKPRLLEATTNTEVMEVLQGIFTLFSQECYPLLKYFRCLQFETSVCSSNRSQQIYSRIESRRAWRRFAKCCRLSFLVPEGTCCRRACSQDLQRWLYPRFAGFCCELSAVILDPEREREWPGQVSGVPSVPVFQSTCLHQSAIVSSKSTECSSDTGR